jgi:hypothetical protein
MKKWQLGLATVATIAMMAGCGGGSDGGGSAPKNTAKYLDSAVANIDYKCGKIEGTTDKEGTFNFEAGSDCSLSVGTIPVRQIASESLFSGAEIVESNLTVSAFLMTLDQDGNASNGITIAEGTGAALKKAGIESIPSDGIMSGVATALSEKVDGYKGTAADIEAAKKHLENTQVATLTEILSGKTFYAVGYYVEYEENDHEEKEFGLSKLTFNKDVTQSSWEILKSSEDEDVGEKGKDSIKVTSWQDYNSDVLVPALEISGNDDEGTFIETIILSERTKDYIKFISPDSCIKFYTDKAKAEAAYKKLTNGSDESTK